jgi:hypothetical protein
MGGSYDLTMSGVTQQHIAKAKTIMTPDISNPSRNERVRSRPERKQQSVKTVVIGRTPKSNPAAENLRIDRPPESVCRNQAKSRANIITTIIRLMMEMRGRFMTFLSDSALKLNNCVMISFH